MSNNLKKLIESMIRDSLASGSEQLNEYTDTSKFPQVGSPSQGGGGGRRRGGGGDNWGNGGGGDDGWDGEGFDDDEDGPYHHGMNFGQYQDSFTHHAVHIKDKAIRHALVKEMGAHVRKFTAAIDREDMRGARAGLVGMKSVHDQAVSHSSVKVPLHKIHDEAWMGANAIERGDPVLFDKDTIHIKQK